MRKKILWWDKRFEIGFYLTALIMTDKKIVGAPLSVTFTENSQRRTARRAAQPCVSTDDRGKK